MPRCVVCDYCSETDGNDFRSFSYREEERGDVCGKCSGVIREFHQHFYLLEKHNNPSEAGAYVLSEFDSDVGLSEVLEVGSMEGHTEEDAG